MKIFIVTLPLCLILFSSPSYSEVYKCKDSEDVIAFQQTPCATSESRIDLPAHLSLKKRIVDISKFEAHGVRLGTDKSSVEAAMKFIKFKKTNDRKTSAVYENGKNKNYERIAITYTKVNSDSTDYAYNHLPDSQRTVKSYNFIAYTDEYASLKDYEDYLKKKYGDIFYIYHNEKFNKNGKNRIIVTVSLADEDLKKRFKFELSVSENNGSLRISGTMSPKIK